MVICVLQPLYILHSTMGYFNQLIDALIFDRSMDGRRRVIATHTHPHISHISQIIEFPLGVELIRSEKHIPFMKLE